MKASVFIAMSLDGFIARPNGELDWLDAANAKVSKDEDFGYHAFIKTVDVLVMGRKTYEYVLTCDEWPYKDVPVIVLSRQPITFPANLPKTITCSSEEPPDLCNRLSQEGIQHIYVDGGITIQRFLAHGLINNLTITLIPTILGEGTPLFGSVPQDILLQCLSSYTFKSGFTQIKYTVLTEDI
ncbi:MAG: dihydrofolate reductase [Spirulina sp. SIO3F2]|nr:dihydrofolate reductase [Spirulina sp. SIO3F2]